MLLEYFFSIIIFEVMCNEAKNEAPEKFVEYQNPIVLYVIIKH